MTSYHRSTANIKCNVCERQHLVQRPQAYQPDPDTWGSAFRRNWPEIVFGVLILLSFWIGIPWLAGMAA